MNLFSERNGYTVKSLQMNTITPELRNRIWNTYSCEVCTDCVGQDSNYLEEIMDSFGLTYRNIYDEKDIAENLENFKRWYMKADWYRVYDFVEVYLKFLSGARRDEAIKQFNSILQWENSGYRIVDALVVSITNGAELNSIEEAQDTKYDSVNRHIEKATQLFSQRPFPDYENSIKESISVVEALCCIITGDRNATLGSALKKLEKRSIKLHASFKSAMDKLYGYASDEGGIRHGSIEFADVSCAEAKYMLLSCSAFVNYLIEILESVVM